FSDWRLGVLAFQFSASAATRGERIELGSGADELARGRKRLAKSGRIADSAGAVGGEEGLPAGEAARLRLARRRRRRQARGVDERVREIEIVLDERRRAG